MAFLESAGRFAATLAAMAHTRLELATVEIEEESQRFLRYLILSLLALFLAGVAVILVALFVVLVFWDSYRLQAVAAMAVLFAGGGWVIAVKVRNEMRAKPPLLSATLGELRQDFACVTNLGARDEE
ncbi:MAG TPA: phage holin family protein [Telluria sp.]|nr:phage holin family protein [Telluria sp.]